MLKRLRTTAQTVGLLHRIIVSVALGIVTVVETKRYLNRETHKTPYARKRIR